MQLARKQLILHQNKAIQQWGLAWGFREEIPASVSLLLIIDVSNYLFIHLSSPLLSFPLSACSVFDV